MRCPARSDQNRQATQHGLCVAVPNPVTGEIPACRSGSGIDFEFFGVAIRFFPPADACMALCALPYRPGRIAALILGHRLAAPQQLRIRSQRRETNSAAVAAPFARSPPAPHSAETEIEITLPSPTREYQMKNLKIASTLIAALMLTAVVGCASTAKQESTGEYVSDTAITTAVKAAILTEPSLKVNEINVETFKGAVQLSGFVRSQDNIATAVRVARGVKGVTSVKNDMRLK
jgi:osmotically-inducible protein OsmY